MAIAKKRPNTILALGAITDDRKPYFKNIGPILNKK